MIFSITTRAKNSRFSKIIFKIIKCKFFGNFIKPQKFNDTIKGVTIYAEKKDNEGILYNLYLKRELRKMNFKSLTQKKECLKKL